MSAQVKKQNIPDGWVEKKLGDVLKIGSGKDYKHLEVGDIPVFGTGGYMLSVNNTLHEGETVFIGRKGTINKPFYFKGKFWTVDTLFYTRDYKETTARYINYVFQKINWLAYNEASGVPSLSKTTIENIYFNFPPLLEQNRIVSVLETWDISIERLKRKIEIRKSVQRWLFQELLTGKRRLSEFSDKWQTLKLGDIGKVSMCKRIFQSQTSAVGDIPFFKIGTFGKSSDAFISKEVYEEYKNKYSFPKKGEVLISASGTIGRTVVYDEKPAYFQDSNIVWISNDEKKVLNSFLFYAYKLTEWQTDSSTIARLYNDNLRRVKIYAPDLEEQKEISNILIDTDSEIDRLQKKLELLKDQKAYLLNNLITGTIRTPESLSIPK